MKMDYEIISHGSIMVDIYGGEMADEHRPYVSVHTIGDTEPFEGVEAVISSRVWPVGTVFDVKVPCCPTCQLNATYQDPHGFCECGFDWKVWCEEKYG